MASHCTDRNLEAGLSHPARPTSGCLQEPFSRPPCSPWTWMPVYASSLDACLSPPLPPWCSVPRGPRAPIRRRRTRLSPSHRRRGGFDSQTCTRLHSQAHGTVTQTSPRPPELQARVGRRTSPRAPVRILGVAVQGWPGERPWWVWCGLGRKSPQGFQGLRNPG